MNAMAESTPTVMLNLFQHSLRSGAVRAEKWTLKQVQGDGRMKGRVGSFCCPVLPEPLESPSVARWGPTAL
jgi:hypothetical protein